MDHRQAGDMQSSRSQEKFTFLNLLSFQVKKTERTWLYLRAMEAKQPLDILPEQDLQ